MAKNPRRPAQQEPTGPTASDLGQPLLPTGIVTVLQIVGTGVELRLSPEQRSFSIGSAAGLVDLFVSSPVPPDARTRTKRWQRVSRHHASIERRLNRLWIKDHSSKNGILVNGRKQDAGEIVAGEWFGLGQHDPIVLLALDELLVLLRREFQWVLGFDAHAVVDAALAESARGSHLLLLGDRGCDQQAIAEHVHRASTRRRAGFAELGATATEEEAARALAIADLGTLYLDLHRVKTPLPRAVIAAARDERVRLVASAETLDQTIHRFGSRAMNRFGIVEIPSLSQRTEDVPRLLDALLLRHGSRHHIGQLGTTWVDALVRARWASQRETNLDALRLAVPRIDALMEHRSITGAAEALGISHQAMSQWLARLGLPSAVPKKLLDDADAR